jgi:hypothetical protein
MAHDTRSANLISQRNTDCHAFATIAIHYRLDPVTQCHTRHTIRPHDPVTLYNAARSRLTALDYDMTHRQAGRTHGGKESLFIWEAGRHDRGDP